MSERDFWLIVDGLRREDFDRVFGTHCVPVTSPRPQLAELPGFEDAQEVYLLDLEWVREQGRRDALVEFIAERFGLNPVEVARRLDEEGMPLLAADTTLRIDHPQRWLS